jgi:uncharacterized repeat protein (TIGR01451 family)
LITSNNNTIRGLIIGGFGGGGYAGVHINAAVSGNTIVGNYLGTNYAGTASNGNRHGVYLQGGAFGNTVGGSTAADRNIISGNVWRGVRISGVNTQSNIVKGNYIGTTADGLSPLPNVNEGINLNGPTISNIIGGTNAGEGNLISGNGAEGILIAGMNTTPNGNNVIKGNYIGTNANGTAGIPNVYGIRIDTDGQNNTIGGTASGEGNVIAFNTNAGIFVTDAASDGNKISGNSIFSNGNLGIDIGAAGVGPGANGANNDKAAPTIGSITPSGGNFAIVATVGSGDTLEFFRVNNGSSPAVILDPTGFGEGYLFLGSCVDNGACSGPHVSAVADANPAAGTVQATLLTSGVNGGDFVSATATDASNNTSEFSANSQVPLSLVKQVWQVGGSSPLATSNGAPSSVTVPAGDTVVFLIYVKNSGSSAATDLRFLDLLDVSASGFDYVAESLVRDDGSLSDAATDLQIFNATAPGTGTALNDAVNGDIASVCDSGAGVCPGTTLNRVTVGNTTGLTPAQANGTLSIAANKTFAIRFRAVKK